MHMGIPMSKTNPEQNPVSPVLENVDIPGDRPASAKKVVARRREADELPGTANEPEGERVVDADSQGNGTVSETETETETGTGTETGTETGGGDEPTCRQIHSDGTEEDCSHTVVAPWVMAGGAMLLAGVGAAASSGGSGSDRASAASPPPAPTPAPTPTPAPPPLAPAPRLSTSSGKDTIDGHGHVDVAVASPGAPWVYRIDGDTTWHAGQGDRIDTGALGRGVHAVMVAQLDEQGRRGEVATLAVRVHDDMMAPALALAHDNGSSATDGLTNDGTITVSALAAGATWFYRVNGATEWTEGKDAQVPAGALVAGQNRIEAYQVGAGGEHGPLTSLTVTLDLSPPEAPMLQTSNGAELLNARDFINVSGIEGGAAWKFRVNGQGDWIDGHDGRIPASALVSGENRVEVVQVDAAGNASVASNITVRQDLDAPDLLRTHLEGDRNGLISTQGGVVLDNLEVGATWKYRINGESEWHVGSGSLLSANDLVEGRNDLTLVQTDSSGHDSAVLSVTVTRDSQAPDRPDLVTSNGLPLINAQGSLLVHQLEDQATWEYRIDGGEWIAGQGDALAAGALHEGIQTVDVRQTDLAGNVSGLDSLTVTLDSAPPDALVATVRKQGGAVAADHLINAAGYVSIGNLEAGATWEFKVNDDDHWRSGGGQQLPVRLLDEGANTIEFRQIDAAGNVGAASSAQVTLDTMAPDSPTLSSSTGKWLMNQGIVWINGVEPGAQLTVKVDGRTPEMNAISEGVVGFQVLGQGFGQGKHAVEAYVTDAAGNVSRSAVVSYTLDTVSPAAPRLVQNDSRIDSLSDYLNVFNVESGATWWYRVDSKGDWIQGSGGQIPGSAFINTSASSEYHSVEVRQVDQAGNPSIVGHDSFWSDIPPPAGV